jgi:hypothetical protein
MTKLTPVTTASITAVRWSTYRLKRTSTLRPGTSCPGRARGVTGTGCAARTCGKAIGTRMKADSRKEAKTVEQAMIETYALAQLPPEQAPDAAPANAGAGVLKSES